MNQYLKQCIKHEFFMADDLCYDYERVMCFCLLYSSVELQLKTDLLFQMICTPPKMKKFELASPAVLRLLETFVLIGCHLMAQFIHSNMETFLSPNERESFKLMYSLFEQSTVNGCLKDFAIITRNKVMHPSGQSDT